MKSSVKNLFNLLFIIFCLLGSLTCEQYELVRLTKLSTGSITEITSTSAKASGLFGDVSSNISEFGHCWSTEKEPKITDNITTATGTAKRAGEIITELSDLLPEMMYYVRAYAIVKGEPVYGDEVTFTTSNYVAPTISTTIVSAIDHESAVSGGNISDDGGQSITARGVCWSTSESPTITDNKTTDGTGAGVYSSQLTGLLANTTYYVRAYATTSVTTIYGNQQSFTTTEAKTITVQTPNSESHWGGGSTFTISWTDNITENVIIQLYKNDVFEANIEGGAGTASTSPYEWTVPTNIEDGTDYKIKITSVDNDNITGFSEAFEIAKPPTDFDNNTYKIVKIGDQWWMAENLKTTRYSNGDVLLDGTGVGDISGNFTSKYYFAYNDVAGNVDVYGRLYTWAAALDGATGSDTNPSNRQGVCPTNWHIPSDAEWKEMEMFLGMSSTDADAPGLRGTDQGGQLKEAGTTHWNTPNSSENNSSGFTALPGGYRNTSGFSGINTLGHFWTSASATGNNAWYRELSFNTDQIIREEWLKNFGRSVRCVKNNN